MKKLLLGLVVLIVLAIGALAVLNFVFDQKKTKRQTISGKVTAIVIKSDAGDVDLKPGSGPVEIRETQHYVITKPKLKQKLEGGVLTLDTPDCDIPVVKCYADLELTVPAGIKVTVDSDSGDIDANGISVLNAHLESDSGDVQGDFKGRQLLAFAHTDSGDVDVAVEDARAVDAQTDSGGVKINADGHPLKIVAKTDSGDVDVAVPAGHYAIDADSDSGDVKTQGLTDTDKSPKSIAAKSDSGDIKIHAR